MKYYRMGELKFEIFCLGLARRLAAAFNNKAAIIDINFQIATKRAALLKL